MKFDLVSLKNGKTYSVAAEDVPAFYATDICGRAKSLVAGILFSGTVLLQLFNGNGELIHALGGPNLVTTAGLGAVVDRMQSTSPAVWDYQGIGTGVTAANVTDTALGTEVGTRTQGTLSQPAATTDRLVTTFAAGNGTAAITETARFTASSSGVCVARQVFSAINKAAGDSLAVTHDITVS